MMTFGGEHSMKLKRLVNPYLVGGNFQVITQFRNAVVVLLTGFVAAGYGAPAHAEDRSYILTTGTTGGTYYPVGVAIATLTKIKLQPSQGVSLSAISSAGSAENIKLLREKEAQLAIVQGIYAAWAGDGTGPLANDGPQKHLRAITTLWQNVEHIVVRSNYVTSGTVEDLAQLKGQSFSIGKRNSGAEGSGKFLLDAVGISWQTSFNTVFKGYGPSADALQNGTIAGMNLPAGIPVSAVTRVYASLGSKVRILGFTDDHLRKANAKYNIYSRFVIPAGTYPNQADDIASIAMPNVLAVRADVPDDDVYQITKAIFENLPFLNTVHPATKSISLDSAFDGLPLPLHNGAARYFSEKEIALPDTVGADQ